ncbi:AMP-binding protein [Micromonospora sp. B9E7]|uniref:AMP-binding protein n=1 Tax=Micromonospora sp. B9E7 TaxID=3153574 RepID=UPI00325E6E38
MVSGAAAMPPTVRQAVEARTGVPICDGYGLTEATCASARILPGNPRSGSAGLRMPYQQIRAVSPADGRPLPPGETGVKPALRADAVRRVLVADIPGIEVVVGVEDGTPMAEVTAGNEQADQVRESLGRYSFRWILRIA